MKTSLLTGVAFTALASATALAADLPRKAPPPAPVICPTCDWNGFYVGVNVGGSIGQNRTSNSASIFPAGAPFAGVFPGVFNPISSVNDTRSPSGVIGGGQIGWNLNVNRWLFGVEADFSGTNQRDTLTSSNFVASTIGAASANLSYSDEQRLNWLATVRGRLGWTYDCFLTYVTGGVAFGEVESNLGVSLVNTGPGLSFGSGSGAASFKTTKTGWTIGSGVETSLAWMGWSPNWSMKLEYLYVDLGSVTNSVTAPVVGATGGAPNSVTLANSHDIRDHIIRFGLNYRFGAPAHASYASGPYAADMPVKARPTPVCVNCNWNGFYVGANFGTSIGQNKTSDSASLFPAGVPFGAVFPGVVNPVAATTDTRTPKGVLGGGQIGWNLQTNRWVVGLEADLSGTNQRDTLTSSSFVSSTIAAASANLSYSDEQRLNWLATVRARLGWTHDCFLWYVTGGVAFGEVESNLGVSFVNTAPAPGLFGSGSGAASFKTTKTGWTVGGGVETSLTWFGLSRNWSAKTEYLYVDLGSVTNSVTAAITGGGAAAPTSVTLASSHDIRDHIIRAGINYRFQP